MGPLSVSGSLVLVRHARPDMTDHRPETWGLTGDGIDDARRLGAALRTSIPNRTAPVVCSTEPKAVETAAALGVGAVRSDARLGEVDRPWLLDAVGFWEDLEMPDAWLVDLGARSTRRIAVDGGRDRSD
jgi:broad specificity phosphatase PhoE